MHLYLVMRGLFSIRIFKVLVMCYKVVPRVSILKPFKMKITVKGRQG